MHVKFTYTTSISLSTTRRDVDERCRKNKKKSTRSTNNIKISDDIDIVSNYITQHYINRKNRESTCVLLIYL